MYLYTYRDFQWCYAARFLVFLCVGKRVGYLNIQIFSNFHAARFLVLI